MDEAMSECKEWWWVEVRQIVRTEGRQNYARLWISEVILGRIMSTGEHLICWTLWSCYYGVNLFLFLSIIFMMQRTEHQKQKSQWTACYAYYEDECELKTKKTEKVEGQQRIIISSVIY
jgi:hypothetical protein